jgi:hypothetical protein
MKWCEDDNWYLILLFLFKIKKNSHIFSFQGLQIKTLKTLNNFAGMGSTITLWYFILSVNTHFNGLLNPDPPLKSTAPFGSKITQADSTLETAPPPLFPDPVSRSGSDYLLYYLRTC